MGNPTTNQVHRLKVGNAGARAVLYVFADVACDDCGRAWPGVTFLSERTEIGTTKIRKALDYLKDAGLIKIHAYPAGGRGVTTEYIVLPQLPKLSTAPCGKCGPRSKTQRTGVGYSVAGNPIPNAFDPNTQRTGVDHPLLIHDPLASASPPSVETGENPPAGNLLRHSPPVEIPEESQDALRALGLFTTPREPEPGPTKGKAQG